MADQMNVQSVRLTDSLKVGPKAVQWVDRWTDQMAVQSAVQMAVQMAVQWD